MIDTFHAKRGFDLSNSSYGFGVDLAGRNIQLSWQDDLWDELDMKPLERLRDFRMNNTEEEWLGIFKNDPPIIPRGQTSIEKLVTILCGERPDFTMSIDGPKVTYSPHDNAVWKFRFDFIESVAEDWPENVKTFIRLMDDEEFLRGFADTLIERFNEFKCF